MKLPIAKWGKTGPSLDEEALINMEFMIENRLESLDEEKYLQEMINMTYKYYGDNDISDIDFVRHQYFDNPKGKAFITLAQEENNQRIVGQYVVLPMEIRINRENQKKLIV